MKDYITINKSNKKLLNNIFRYFNIINLIIKVLKYITCQSDFTKPDKLIK